MAYKNNWSEYPVLITGLPGTGTSLLMDLIDGHKNIIVYPAEPYFRDVFKRKYKNKTQLLADWKIGTFNTMHQPKKWVLNLYAGHDPKAIKPIELCDEVIEHIDSLNDFSGQLRSKDPLSLDKKNIFNFKAYFNSMNKLLDEHFFSLKDIMRASIISTANAASISTKNLKYWVFKDPDFISFNRYFSLYLEGKVIFISRDPRSFYSTVKNRYKTIHGIKYDRFQDILKCTYGWVGRMRLINTLMKTYGDERILILAYEDLVNDVVGQMRRIAVFLDIEYDEVFEKPTRFGIPISVATANHGKGNTVYKNAALKWRNSLNHKEKSLIDIVSHKTAQSYGYALYQKNPVLLSLGDLLFKLCIFCYKSFKNFKNILSDAY